jgi:hypothetical protein
MNEIGGSCSGSEPEPTVAEVAKTVTRCRQQ